MRSQRSITCFTLILALASALTACAIRPPGTAVPESEAERVYGTLNAATPLAAIIKSRDIQPLDQRRPVPLLDQLLGELAKTDPDKRYRGVTYGLTRANALDRDWILQTPDRWHRSAADLPFYPLRCEGCVADVALPACRSDADCGGGASCRPLAAVGPARADKRVCVGHSDATIDRLYKLVAQARTVVDVTALQPPPDGRFLAALRNGLTALARSGRAVTVRVLVGQYPLEGGTNVTALAAELLRDARSVPGSRLSVHVAAMRSCMGGAECASFSWNHSKIVAVDGAAALVGGHNLWSRDYLIEAPVHDLSMALRGPAAADASRFADALWGFVCERAGRDAAVQALSHAPGDEKFGTGCLARLPLPPSRGAGGVPIMAVGRLGSGITTAFANQGDLARDLMLGAARRSILIVQQDFAFTLGRLDPLYPESTLERIADFLLSGGDVRIVLSNLGSTGLGGSSYSNGVSIETMARKIRQVARGRGALPDAELDALLCRRLHLAPFRFGPDAVWPGNRPIGNHSKFWMIDDRAFYIGSDNFYPVDLQEFGYIVDDRAAAATLRRDYWDPLWRWSRLAAVSGEGAPRCVFTEAAKAASK